MIDNFNNNTLQIKSFVEDNLDQDSSCHIVTERDILCFEYYMKHNSCSQCRQDHRFKPSFECTETSIESAPQLIALFFNKDCSQDDTQGIRGHKEDPDVIDHIINQIFDRTGKAVE